MILRQFLHTDPAAISYLFGCGGHAAGAVVDPVGEAAPHLRAAEASGPKIRFVIDTHRPADHRSAGRTLSGKPWSTIGFERRHNVAFRIDEAAAFVAFMQQEIPPAPPQAAAFRAWNAGRHVAAAD
jgi:glyoxylase-like metal-dependent hydrolase (beta-lactamase superfamily II)